MVIIREIIFLTVCAAVFGTNPTTVFEANGKYRMEISENVSLMFYGHDGSSPVLNASHTSSVFKTNGPFRRCKMGKDDLDVCLNWGAHVMNVSIVSETCLQVETSQPGGTGEVSVCFPYDDVNWFGGPSLYNQSWPVQLVEVQDTPFLTGYSSGQRIAEPFWFSSKGVSIYVFPDVPLFWDSNANKEKKLCLKARDAKPYIPRDMTILRYEICTGKNAIEVQRAAVDRYFQKPTVRTSAATFQDVTYSTLVRYGQNFTQETLSQLVTEIQQHNYPIGRLKIEDNWESCYGSLVLDTPRLSSLPSLTKSIHDLGGNVSAWIHPYVSKDCQQYYDDFLLKNQFVYGDETINVPWDGGNSGVIDFSKSAVAANRAYNIKEVQNQFGFDSFKFDLGQSYLLPSTPQLTGNQNNTPDFFIKKYVEMASTIPGLHEVSFGRSTQNFSVFVGMSGKSSQWGLDNGLQSVLTTLFQMNLAGYPFVIADYVGGNQKNRISKELFIRWLQAVTFMPVIQFSVVPWDFDIETVEISRELLALHNSYANLFQSAAVKALNDGTPINTPIWWIAPDDPLALNCTDEYLLAESVLVAPVLQEGVTVRDVYLPEGTWYNSKVGTVKGPKSLRVEAPLNTLLYFVKDTLRKTIKT